MLSKEELEEEIKLAQKYNDIGHIGFIKNQFKENKMKNCQCRRLKKEISSRIIIYNDFYKTYCIQNVERNRYSGYSVENIKINNCPWCGKELYNSDGK